MRSDDQPGAGLRACGLSVRFGEVQALSEVDLEVSPGRILAVLGESGAGKSTLAHALSGMLYLPTSGEPTEVAGSVAMDDTEIPLHALAPAQMRGTTVALLLQACALNPQLSVRQHLSEPFCAAGLGRPSREKLFHMCDEIGLPQHLLDRRPHQLSGGQSRRVALAAALALCPKALVLDEPTAGLDPLTSSDLLVRIAGVVRNRRIACVLVTHSLPDATRVADDVLVLYAGQVMETGRCATVLGSPRHPYTRGLIGSVPFLRTGRDLHPIRGTSPDPTEIPNGCPFHPRCPQTIHQCQTQRPPLVWAERGLACHRGGILGRLTATGLGVSFGGRAPKVFAVDGVEFEVAAGEAVGVIGASGSGKSTLARLLSGHLRPTTGSITCDGIPLLAGQKAGRRRVQLVQQDPFGALSPRWTVAQSLQEALDLSCEYRDTGDDRTQIADVLHEVGLVATSRLLDARPAQLSGGQLQRIVLARALLATPAVLIADEPTSMLDPSEQARLALLLRDRQIEHGLSLVVVSHDLGLVRKITDRVVVLAEGRIAESGRTDEVLHSPRSDPARALVAASPSFHPHTYHERNEEYVHPEPSTPTDPEPSPPSRNGRSPLRGILAHRLLWR